MAHPARCRGARPRAIRPAAPATGPGLTGEQRMKDSTRLRGLYAITDSKLLAEGRLLPYVEAALKGGARLLQYRDKSSDEARRLREADALQELCARHGAQLIINDDAELAARLGVGLHLGQQDGSPAAARALNSRQAIIAAPRHANLPHAAQDARTGARTLPSLRSPPCRESGGRGEKNS